MPRLFIGGLPGIIERDELEKVFGRFGVVEDVWVARKPPGFAFVQYADVRDAEAAIRNLNDTSQFGATIRVEFSLRGDHKPGGGRRSSPPPRRGAPSRSGPLPRSDRGRMPPARSGYGRDYAPYRASPPPQRSYRSSPPRMYHSPPRASYRMSPPPQRSYRASPPPGQRYFNRSPQRPYRSSPPPMRSMYRESPPAARPSYRGASPPHRYEYGTPSRPLPSRDYGSSAPVYGGRSPVRAPRGYSPPRSNGPSYGMDMGSRYPGVRYRSRSRSPIGRGYY